MQPLPTLIPNIAVIPIEGRIGRAVRSEDVTKQLAVAKRLPFIRGILLRIDSPGGDAYDSEEIRVEVERLAKDKPVVAHIARIGASGAYLAALAANEVVASKWSVVGSIGVIVMRPNVTSLIDKLGIDVVVRKTGEFKDLGSPFRVPTPEDELKEGELIGELYRDFMDVVAKSRGLDESAVQAVATGEVFTGRRACELGLVDSVGDEQAAIERLEGRIGSKAKLLEMRLPGGGRFRKLRPAACIDAIAGPYGALSMGPRFEWSGYGA